MRACRAPNECKKYGQDTTTGTQGVEATHSNVSQVRSSAECVAVVLALGFPHAQMREMREMREMSPYVHEGIAAKRAIVKRGRTREGAERVLKAEMRQS